MSVQILNIIRPKSKREDSRRREFILNVLLLGAIALSAVSAAITQVNATRLGLAYHGVPPRIVVVLLLFFLALYLASRAGFYIEASYVLTGIYFAAATYAVYTWGVDLHAGLLTYALIIVISGVLISTRFAFITTFIIASTLSVLMYLQVKGIIVTDSSWRVSGNQWEDLAVFVLIFSIIVIVSWLSNREIEKSLQRARNSETLLKEERDHLEEKVEERTRQLKQAQLEKMVHLYRFAELGRMASGLFHDFVNPLSVVSMNLEVLQGEGLGKKLSTKRIKSLVDRAMRGTKRMESFVGAARRQLQHQEVSLTFSVGDEIHQVVAILKHRALEAHVAIRVEEQEVVSLYGDPIKFNQVMTNLLSNAVDAYESLPEGRKHRRVLVRIGRTGTKARVDVQDWGCGIKKDSLNKIFEPFFTTKDVEHGTGIGLTLAKEIAENNFNGKIMLKSKEGEGTIFTVLLPIRHEPADPYPKERSRKKST